MENKIDIAAILKDCPRGMELDCAIYDGVTLDSVVFESENHYENIYPIKIVTGSGFSTRLTKYGQNVDINEAKCVIFPKGKTTWEDFQRPFKDGDIIYNRLQHKICIYYLCEDTICINHCRYNELKNIAFEKLDTPIPIAIQDYRLATEEEKQKLFQVIESNGYKWNPETKNLEKLIILKFKIGDKVRGKYTNNIYTISRITSTEYELTNGQSFTFNDEDCYELVPDKFDVTTLKPYDKVLVRDSIFGRWKIEFFEKFDKELKFPFICMNGRYSLCIPYNDNEYLHDTILPCNDYYQI